MKKTIITLAHGSGGAEMQQLINSFNLQNRGKWKNYDNDSATIDLDGKQLIFTTDSFIVDPVFFPGGDIGHLAFSGTVNDLAVLGATPLGLSLSFVIEEGFSTTNLEKIINSINRLSNQTNIPIVTGDTKVMQKGKIDKIIVNTSGIGIATNEELLTKPIDSGDKIILSGGLGEHAVALLSQRFDYETDIVTDSKPIITEIKAIQKHIKIAKDPTRGGIAAILNEICEKNHVGMLLDDEKIPVRPEVRKVTEMLGINLYELASEGRFVCIVSKEKAQLVEKKLQKFNPDASIIGEIIDDNKVFVQTMLGKRILPTPSGRIVPRIC